MTTKAGTIGQMTAQAVATLENSSKELQKASPVLITKSETGEKSISVYSDKRASLESIGRSMVRLECAFPKMSDAFFSLLTERIYANKFTEKRLKDAINHLIDNFGYKELNVADIIRFDRKAKLHSYNEVCRMVSKGEAAFSDFEIREINGECYRIKKTDLIS